MNGECVDTNVELEAVISVAKFPMALSMTVRNGIDSEKVAAPVMKRRTVGTIMLFFG